MKIAIVGYGNLGSAAELLHPCFPDLTLTAIYTRRPPESLPRTDRSVPLLPIERLEESDAECLILAGSSDRDLPLLAPEYAERFHIVDSFDTHAKIPEHLSAVGRSAEKGGRVALIAAGWDPGLLSLARIYTKSFLPYAKCNTFWGEGVSQGHSAAVRHIPGVKDAKAYTLPRAEAKLLASQGIALRDTERHRRKVYIVEQEGADRNKIARAVARIPGYFAGYETEVVFMDEKEFRAECRGLPHKGEVIAVGRTGKYRENRSSVAFSLSAESNPEFTASILLASARAVKRLAEDGKCGAFTFADIPPKYFLPPDVSLLKML